MKTDSKNQFRLTAAFYQREDVLVIARELLGKWLFTNIDGLLTAGIITETEAYAGTGDKASHAYDGRYTKRTRVMYQAGGVAYIYLCYGVHSLFNVVTNLEGRPDAVLIRGIFPVIGIGIMNRRGGITNKNKPLGTGPGKVAQLLGIHYSLTGVSLEGKIIWIEDRNTHVHSRDFIAGPRIGVAYAAEDALLPYRFIVQNHSCFDLI